MTYTANITREGSDWLADIPTVPGAHTYARSLEGLTKAIREVIILMDDLPDDATPDIDMHFTTDDAAVAAAEHLRRRRQDLAKAETELIAETSRLAAILTDNYSVRDTATMLGVTAGRISQIA